MLQKLTRRQKKERGIVETATEMTPAVVEEKPTPPPAPAIQRPSVKTGKNILKGKIAVRCLVLYRPEHGGKKIQEVYDAPMGITWQYRGKPCRLLYENPRTGDLEPYIPHGKELGIIPSKLSRCRQCLPAKNLLAIHGSLAEKFALWAIVAAIGIGGILIIAIMGELNKGKV